MLSVFKNIMMIIVGLLFIEQAYTRCVFYTIQVTPYSRNDSAYDAFFNAATFVGVKGPSRAGSLASGIEGFRKHWQEPAEEGTQQSRQRTVAVWQGEAAKFVPADRLPRYLLEHELLQLIIYTPKFNGWYEAGLLGIINGSSEFTRARITKALEAVRAGKLIAFMINVKSIEPMPHWVVVGIGKEAGDFHVCLMDSVGGAFDNKTDGTPADLLVMLERVLTAADTPFSLGDGYASSLSGGLPTHQTGTLAGITHAPSDAGAAVAGAMATAAASSPVVGAAAAAAMPVGGTVDLGGALCRVGLVNQGGTCYQNSVLQALHKSFYFRQLLARILSNPSIETDAGDGSEIIRQLRDTFVWLGQNDLVVPPGFLNPFYNPVSFATDVVNYMGFESVGRHQDAQEFMTRLFGLLQLKGLLPDPTLKDYDRTADDFNAVEYQEELTCKICGYRRMSPPRPDFTYLLSLSIPAGGSGVWPVEELLRAYRNIEDMGEGNLVACEHCNLEGGKAEERLELGRALQASRKAGAEDAELVARVEAMRVEAQTTFVGRHPGAAFSVDTTFPFSISTPHTKANRFIISPTHPFLILQIKRFFYDKDTLQRGKFVTPIIFPADGVAVIEDSEGVVHRFRVVSAVVHLGSLGGGHYWCVAGDGIYNDTTVTLDGGAALASLLATGHHEGAQGYLYFLERVAAQ